MLEPEELDRAVREVEEQVQILRHPRDHTLLQNCVLAWCQIFGWPQEIAGFAVSLNRAHAAHLGRIAFGIEHEVRLQKKVLRKNMDFEKERFGRVTNVYFAFRRAGRYLWRDRRPSTRWSHDQRFGVPSNAGRRAGSADYTAASDEEMSKMDSRDYILIALLITVGGYVLYCLRRRRQRPVNTSPVSTKPVSKKSVLVLVINAGRDSVIHALRSGGVAALEGDQLYQATQALWFGNEADFPSTGLEVWFSKTRAVREHSEYDVHLVRVDLSTDDPGLQRNANYMDRLDAFRRLRSNGVKTTISERLPSDAYGTTDVYSR